MLRIRFQKSDSERYYFSTICTPHFKINSRNDLMRSLASYETLRLPLSLSDLEFMSSQNSGVQQIDRTFTHILVFNLRSILWILKLFIMKHCTVKKVETSPPSAPQSPAVSSFEWKTRRVPQEGSEREKRLVKQGQWK